MPARFTDVSARYLAEITPSKAPNSQRGDRYYAAIVGDLDAALVAKVTTADVYRLHKALTADRGPIVANRVLSFVSQVLALAARLGLRDPVNPCSAIPRNRESKRTAHLDARQRRRFREACRAAVLAGEITPSAGGALLLMLFTGLRCCEIRLLRWDEVRQLDDGEVLIRLHERGDLREANKSGDARTIPCGPPAAAVLRSMPRFSAWVFPNRSTAKPYTTLRHAIGKVCERAGLRRLTPHALRHTYGTALAEAGCSPDEIACLMGHKGRESASRYIHLAGRAGLAAAKRAAALVAGGEDW